MLVHNKTKIYVGTTSIKKAYEGTTIIYKKEDEKPFNYIDTDLILLCDGYINSDNGHATGTPSIWKNLKGTVDLAFNSTTAWEITDDAMRLSFPNGTYLGQEDFKLMSNNSLTSSGAWTIEQYVTIVSGGGSSEQLVVLQKSSDIPNGNNIKYCNFLRDSERIQFGGYAGDFYTTPTSYTNRKVLMTTVYTGSQFRVYLDGEFKKTYNYNFNNIKRWLTVGPQRDMWNADRYYDVYYHSVRYYTRALTAEEIAHNYQVDLGRFN